MGGAGSYHSCCSLKDDSLVFLRENDEIFAVDVVSLPYNNLKVCYFH